MATYYLTFAAREIRNHAHAGVLSGEIGIGGGQARYTALDSGMRVLVSDCELSLENEVTGYFRGYQALTPSFLRGLNLDASILLTFVINLIVYSMLPYYLMKGTWLFRRKKRGVNFFWLFISLFLFVSLTNRSHQKGKSVVIYAIFWCTNQKHRVAYL